MTSRLKKKLDHMEEQGTNLNESFCQVRHIAPYRHDVRRRATDDTSMCHRSELLYHR